MVQDLVYTKTIDIAFVNKILKYCPHYDIIVNYEYEYGDKLSSMLIDWYRELIFAVNASDEKQLQIVEALDKGLYLYVKDNKYKTELRKQLKEEDVSLESKKLIKNLIKKIIVFTSKYEQKKIMEVTSAIWI